MRRRSTRRPAAPDEEPSVRYRRGWFVASVVALAVLFGFVLYVTVAGGSDRSETAGNDADDGVDVQAAAPPRSTDPDDCPDPGMPVPYEAAEVLAQLQVAAVDPSVGEIPATDQVQEQLDATSPAAPLSRMTRVRGFAGDSSTVSTCVLSYWTGPTGMMQSLDIVTVAAVDGEDRSDADERDSGSLPDRWEVIRWLRGVPRPAARVDAVPIAFFDGDGCSDPDLAVSVPVPDGEPDERLRSALEELISGAAGRSISASSSVPADLQVLGAEVDGTNVRVELTPTSDRSMSRCDGSGAYAQVVRTAEAIAAESLQRDDDGDLPEIDVEVISGGVPVDTLRP